MSKGVALIALVISVGWAGFAFWHSHRSGDFDRRMVLVVAACVGIVALLGYLSIGSSYFPDICGSGPTAFDC
jgi:low temperature requirement protein LtrA